MTPFWVVAIGLMAGWVVASGTAERIVKALNSAPGKPTWSGGGNGGDGGGGGGSSGAIGYGPLPPQGTSGPTSDFRLDAPATVSARQIDQILTSYNSPAAGLGQAFVDAGRQNNIDPAYALAFFIHESQAGTAGIAQQTRSIGNIRCTGGQQCIGGFRAYATWSDGISDWYRLIRQTYIDQWHLNTVSSIVPVYAPASDGNSPTTYIATIQRLVSSWYNAL